MDGLKIFKFTASGHALRSDIVIVSGDKELASNLARTWLESQDLNPDSLELVSELDFEPDDEPVIVFAWDGDY